MVETHFFEKLNITYNPSDLLSNLKLLEEKFPPVIRKIDCNQYGWMLQSLDGDYKNGFDNLIDIYGNKTKEYDCIIKTQACFGIFEQIINDFSECFRAGIRVYKHNASLNWHCDSGVNDTWFWRYHIPIVPTDKNILSVADKDFVLDEPGRVYRFASWVPHRVINKDPTVHRSHLIFSKPATKKEIEDIEKIVPSDLMIQMYCGKGTIDYSNSFYNKKFN